jgi:hypothetical protein
VVAQFDRLRIAEHQQMALIALLEPGDLGRGARATDDYALP